MLARDDDFDVAEERLRRGGIPPARARRMVREWREHHADLVEAAMASGSDRVSAERTADERLGDLQYLTGSVLARSELRAAGARWPRLVYLCGPLAAYLLAMIVVNVAILIIARTTISFIPGTLTIPLTSALLWLQMYALPVLVAGTFLVLAARQRLPVLWPLAGAALISLVGGNTVAVLALPSASGGDGLLQVSLFYAPEHHSVADGVRRLAANALVLAAPYLYWFTTHSMPATPTPMESP